MNQKLDEEEVAAPPKQVKEEKVIEEILQKWKEFENINQAESMTLPELDNLKTFLDLSL